MCRVLNVSASGYYAWRNRPLSRRAQENYQLVTKIREVHQKNRKAYGSPRVYQALRNEGILCGRHRVARLMRAHGIKARRALYYKRRSQTKHGRGIADNLVKRQFHVPIPNQIWAGDITCFWTGSGWLYLAVVLDLYSRRVIGWSMGGRITELLTIDALKMALLNRTPEKGLIHHSDQGSQYGSDSFQKTLRDHGMECSMSFKGDCYDNAVVESFFKTLKAELPREERRFPTREIARTKLFDYIEVFYNRKRLHSTLGYMSPVQYEERNSA
ncbi:transposase [bacterium F11]|nr:transposase [bacterium F11]